MAYVKFEELAHGKIFTLLGGHYRKTLTLGKDKKCRKCRDYLYNAVYLGEASPISCHICTDQSVEVVEK